jgi:uncharacterized protein YgiM (DUF1202 family)
LAAERSGEDVAQAATKIYVCLPKQLNIRSDPSVDSFILARLKRGTLIKKVKSVHGWWYVQLRNGNEGYVDPKFLAPYGVADGAGNVIGGGYKPASGKMYYINSIRRVTVRSGPTTSSKVKGKIRGGTVVRVLGTSGAAGYIEVYNNGNRGFVPLSTLVRYPGK